MTLHLSHFQLEAAIAWNAPYEVDWCHSLVYVRSLPGYQRTEEIIRNILESEIPITNPSELQWQDDSSY